MTAASAFLNPWIGELSNQAMPLTFSIVLFVDAICGTYGQNARQTGDLLGVRAYREKSEVDL